MFSFTLKFVTIMSCMHRFNCVNMLHVCNNLNDIDIFCDFTVIGEYGIYSNKTHPNILNIHFTRLTNSWINGSSFPNLMNMQIMNSAFDSFNICQHIQTNRLNVIIKFGRKESKICENSFMKEATTDRKPATTTTTPPIIPHIPPTTHIIMQPPTTQLHSHIRPSAIHTSIQPSSSQITSNILHSTIHTEIKLPSLATSKGHPFSTIPASSYTDENVLRSADVTTSTFVDPITSTSVDIPTSTYVDPTSTLDTITSYHKYTRTGNCYYSSSECAYS